MNQAQFLGFIVLGFLAASIESGRKIYTVSGKITFNMNPEIEGLQHISMLHTDDPAVANVRQANYRQTLNKVELSKCLQNPCDYHVDIDDTDHQNGNKVYLGLMLGSFVQTPPADSESGVICVYIFPHRSRLSERRSRVSNSLHFRLNRSIWGESGVKMLPRDQEDDSPGPREVQMHPARVAILDGAAAKPQVFEYDGISAPEGANLTKNLIYEKSKSKHVVYIEGSPTQGHPPKPKPGPVGKMPDPLYTISGKITVEAKPGTDGNQTASLIHTTDSEYRDTDSARGYRQSMDRVKLSDCLQSPCSYKTSIYESDHKDGSNVHIGLKLGGQIIFLSKNEGISRPAAGTKNVVKNMRFVISDAGYTLKAI
ncbi:hypothetical protein Ddc_23503 [Ditylenchus destructor]|nr:hypothetical protein Ddc_23503 [Ditylenchus destructor]